MEINTTTVNIGLSIRKIRLMLALSMIVSYSFATDYYVNDNNPLGDVYCSDIGSNSNLGTAGNPFATLSHVIDVVGLVSGDKVYVDAGVYNQTDITLDITVSNIQIIGAGAGLTTFDNSGSGGTQEYFIQISSPATNVLLMGFTVTGYDYEPGSKGKAITVSGATGVVLDGINTVQNRENGDAAVMVLSNSQVIIRNAISSCNLVSYGGGYQIEGVNIDVLFDNCIVAQNRKTSFNGGGIMIEGTSGASSNVLVNIQNSSIKENWAARGGGIYVSGATLNVSNSCFEANVLSSANESGGGLFVEYYATVTLNQCSFINNTANQSSADGGAIGVNAQNSTVAIQQCFFSGNTANDDGNAIYVDRAYSSGTAIVTVNESIFQTTPSQNNFRKSDASLTITNSGTRQTDSGSDPIAGNNIAQSLGMPTTNCPFTANPCETILPVEFLSFTGSCRRADNLLQFSTASERSNDYFIIEKLNPNNYMEEIGRVNGVGNSISVSSYEFVDVSRNVGDSYYRLSQVDFDGKITQLTTISVKASCDMNSDISSVQYVSGGLRINYSIDKNTELNLQLHGSSGRLVYSTELELEAHGKSVFLPLNITLSSGCYLVQVTNNGKADFHSKLVVN